MKTQGIVKFKPMWQCLDCHETGPAEKRVPSACPKCGSENIHKPAIKMGGPFDPDSMKRY